MNRSSYLLGDIQFSSVHISLVRSRSRSSLKNHFDQLSFPFTCSNNYPIIIRITFGKCLIMPASWLVKTVSKYLPPPSPFPSWANGEGRKKNYNYHYNERSIYQLWRDTRLNYKFMGVRITGMNNQNFSRAVFKKK